MKRNRHLSLGLIVAFFVTGAMSIKAFAVGNGYIQTNVDLVKANMDWATIGSFSTKMSQGKMLTLYTSGECGLFTETNASTQKGKKVTVTASGAVYFRILVNGQPSRPTQVTFCSRSQSLSVVLQGIIDQCAIGANGLIDTTTCTFADESVGLILQTMDANSFVFGFPTTAGTANIQLQAKVVSTTDTGGSTTSTANAWGAIGNVAVAAQQLNLSQQR